MLSPTLFTHGSGVTPGTQITTYKHLNTKSLTLETPRNDSISKTQEFDLIHFEVETLRNRTQKNSHIYISEHFSVSFRFPRSLNFVLALSSHKT